jgi:peptidoglycan/LPS O-acetylase OafA/YrhL
MALESRPRAEVLNVQALRGIAATLVVLSHVGEHERSLSAPHLLAPFTYIGPTGVDLFFAISGFIMTITNWGNFTRPGAPAEFLVRRFIRIFPIYWIVTAAVLAVSFKVHGAIPQPLHLAGALLLVPQAQYPPLGVAWSLIYEMYFYYVFAVLLLFRRSAFAWAVAGWGALTIALNVALHGKAGVDAFLRTAASPFVLEFGLGVIVGLLTVHRRFISPKLVAACAIALTAAALAHLAGMRGAYSGAPYGGWDRFLFAGVPFAVLLYAFVALELHSRVILPRALCAFGNASYSLYLWHELIASGYFRVFARFAHLHGVAGRSTYLLLVVLATIGTSVVLYALIEKPMTACLQKWWRGRHARAPASLVPAGPDDATGTR